jgi:16S rRNA (cytosine1402-N4)-methyltransferase
VILADLGVSSPHLDKANRGFSVLQDGPLDMRMNQSTGRTAADIVNRAGEKEIETILRTYGEEPKARKIAHAIMLQRPFKTTHELADTIKRTYGGYTKHHPAVRSFQALRIAVNDELTLLMDMLPKAVKLLSPGGRLGVITFHSLEDRIVKQFFADLGNMGYEAEIAILTKKPLTPSLNEIRLNPRARSSKLRAVVKK